MKEIKDFVLVCKDIKERDNVLGILKKRFGDNLRENPMFPGDKNLLTVKFWKDPRWEERVSYALFPMECFWEEIITYQEFLDMMVEEKGFLITRTLNEF